MTLIKKSEIIVISLVNIEAVHIGVVKPSRDKLVKNLGGKDFKYLSEEYSVEKLKLVKKKGIYPYEYFNSFKKFKESKLPDIDCFLVD